jgi:hypothetical protein
MPTKTIFLSIAALACFAAAYRFASHGLTLHDNWCVGFACIACAVAVLLLWLAFRDSRVNTPAPNLVAPSYSN